MSLHTRSPCTCICRCLKPSSFRKSLEEIFHCPQQHEDIPPLPSDPIFHLGCVQTVTTHAASSSTSVSIAGSQGSLRRLTRQVPRDSSRQFQASPHSLSIPVVALQYLKKQDGGPKPGSPNALRVKRNVLLHRHLGRRSQPFS